MTFGVNALDWTNIGRKLQTNMAETVGEALTLPAESSVLSPFAYYDGATGTILTTYSAYLDTTSTPADVVTVKTGEDGGNVVVDVTPLTLLYSQLMPMARYHYLTPVRKVSNSMTKVWLFPYH